MLYKLLKRVSTLKLFLLLLISNSGFSQDTFQGKEYLDSLMTQLSHYDKTQNDEKMLVVSSHLMDTLLQFDVEHTTCYYSMAYICRAIQLIGQPDYHDGMAYFEKALESNKTCQNLEYDIKSLNGLGTYSALYLTPDKAIPYFEKADSIRIANDLDYMKFKLNYNLALTYNDWGNGKKALEYLKIAEEIMLIDNDSFRLSAIYHGYALNYDLIENFDNAEVYHEKALLYQPYKSGPQEIYYLNEFINFLLRRKKFEKSSKYQEQLRALLTESSLNYKTQLDDELNKNYAEKEKLLKSEKLNLENQLELEKTNSQNRLFTASLVIILLISLLLIYTFFNLRKQKKVGRLLNYHNERLESSKKATQELLKLKTQFSETVSHELRTPLHGIIGLTDILIDDEKQNLTEKGQKYLDSLKLSADYLLSLINDVLQFSKLDAKKIKLENTIFDVNSLGTTMYSSFNHLAVEKGIKFNIKIDEDIPSYIIGDSVRLSQVLLNLVGNSFKFTEEGRIDLRITKLDENAENVKIKFEIEDTGVGISLSKQSLIFEKFIQINEVNSGKGGTGLGLSIVKQLLELFNSKIHLKSEINEGSVFSFEIDFDKANEEECLRHNNIQKSPNRIIEDGRVLIVDDNQINLIVSESILEKNNYEVVTCDNGFSAIQHVESDEFDLILMDLHMPKMDGVEATRMIKEINPNIPVVLLTASNVVEGWSYYEDLGFVDFIIKPYDKTMFLNKIAKHLQPE